MKIREDNNCGGTSLRISLSNDDQDPCFTETKEEFNAGALLEWSLEDLGSCSANMTLKSPKVEIISSGSDTNFCPEYVTVRIGDNLFAASYQTSFQLELGQKSLKGNRSFIF